MGKLNYLVRIGLLLFLVASGHANELNADELKQQADQFLNDFKGADTDISRLRQLEFSSQDLLIQLQDCEKQAESDLSQLTDIRQIEALKSNATDSQGSQKESAEQLPAGHATQEVDTQINNTTQALITCRMKYQQVAKARLSLLNIKQEIWLGELTQRQDVWSFLKDNNQAEISAEELSEIIPITTIFAVFSLLVLLAYAVMLGVHKTTFFNLSENKASQISLKDTFVLLFKLYVIPCVLAVVYLFYADSNSLHVLILVGGLLVRDCCAALAIKILVDQDKVKQFKLFMWSSTLLLILVAFGFNGIHFQNNAQIQWLVKYSQVFTPLILMMGVSLAISNWYFYQLLKNYKDRYIPLVALLLTVVSTVAFAFSYAYGAQYALLLITGVLLVHWFLKSISWLGKIILSKRISQLKHQEGFEDTTFTFPFWTGLFISLCSGVLGLVFLGWLAGVSEEAFKQISYIFMEGFDVGSVRLVPKDILIGLIIVTILTIALSAVKQGIQNKWFNKSRLRKSSREVFSMVVWYIGITIVVFLGLTVAGFDISKLAIIAGALSVGIGFGLQNIVSNFVSGLILLFERPVTRGDWVEVGETVGLIEKVKIRATTIRTFDNAEILVPNSELLSHHVTNWTLSNSIGRIKIKVGVAYGSDVNKVREILNDIANNHDQVLQREPYKHKVLFREFGDSSLNFELRAMIKNIKMFLDVETDLNFAIDKAFRDAEISIPFPQRDLHIKDSSVIRVNTSGLSDDEDEVKTDELKDEHKNASAQKERNQNGKAKDNTSRSNDTDSDAVQMMIDEDKKRKAAEEKALKKENADKDKNKK